ncbi:acyl-CoA-binding protein-like [Eleutherodactylus coqui]|uniref:acyl-CoA-binding protein-like n=1 Tax=Eleutherodactylus coqui TaxID=57060 RepID=UPI003461CE83
MAEAAFQRAKELVRQLRCKPSDVVEVEFNALVKQAHLGNVNTKRPPLRELLARLEWDAWKRLEGTSQSDAMIRCINMAEELRLKDCKP